MLRPLLALALAAPLSVIAACEPATSGPTQVSTRFQAPARQAEPTPFFTAPTPSRFAASHGHLQGTMGTAVDLDDAADVVTTTDESTWTSLELKMVGHDRAAMAVVDISGGLDQLVNLQGAQRFNENNWDSQVYVQVQGCSGPTDGDWEYDASSYETVVTVTPTEDEGTVQVEVVATLPSASAEVDYDAPDAPATDVARGTFLVQPR